MEVNSRNKKNNLTSVKVQIAAYNTKYGENGVQLKIDNLVGCLERFPYTNPVDKPFAT